MVMVPILVSIIYMFEIYICISARVVESKDSSHKHLLFCFKISFLFCKSTDPPSSGEGNDDTTGDIIIAVITVVLIILITLLAISVLKW